MDNKNFNFEWEFGNFALRTVHEVSGDNSSPLRKSFPVELVKYTNEEHTRMYVVAYYTPTDEGYSLKFVGSRPFEDISAEEIGSVWIQLQAAQRMLDTFYRACEGLEQVD